MVPCPPLGASAASRTAGAGLASGLSDSTALICRAGLAWRPLGLTMLRGFPTLRASRASHRSLSQRAHLLSHRFRGSGGRGSVAGAAVGSHRLQSKCQQGHILTWSPGSSLRLVQVAGRIGVRVVVGLTVAPRGSGHGLLASPPGGCAPFPPLLFCILLT